MSPCDSGGGSTSRQIHGFGRSQKPNTLKAGKRISALFCDGTQPSPLHGRRGQRHKAGITTTGRTHWRHSEAPSRLLRHPGTVPRASSTAEGVPDPSVFLLGSSCQASPGQACHKACSVSHTLPSQAPAGNLLGGLGYLRAGLASLPNSWIEKSGR